MRVVKRPPPELSRRLLNVSDEVLSPDHEPRLEDVAALVGSARATLYYYFSGREDLIGFLIEEHLREAADEIDAATQAEDTPASRLRSAVGALIAFLGRRPGVIAGLLSSAAAAGRLHAVHAAKDAKLIAPLRRILDAGSTTGEFLVDDSSDAAYAILGAAMIATFARWQDGNDVTSAAFQGALADQIVRGVSAPQSA